ncbi:hypothetical protein SUGI_0244850 [Cryptomeria japonica]|uniref:uncharacterized protein LOC131034306 n=1 Tax=Cryptomeria japonica TaxID=3369 RepID=UPI002408C908|nr:uncharacterized protein LOC131034306 [Cryptomeria japonica]GLJ14996.1 hypothetical protein SUGI_0244850 [Cryptomeria japonica]
MSSALFAFWGLLVCLHGCAAHAASLPQNFDRSSAKMLNVGEELTREVLPLSKGQSLYELHGLKAPRWYEVKISYPASIPARFSIAIVQDNSTKVFNLGRRLLNTEKLIFKADNIVPEVSGYDRIFALVSVEPAGVVAKSHFREQQFVIFNIVCDELLFGIPNQAWWVGFVVVLGIAIILSVTNFLPSEWLPRESSKERMKRIS